MPAVGRDIPHDSARGHVTGTSVFLDDAPPLHGELACGAFGSPVAHGKITAIDLSAAERLPGVAALLTHRDVPGHNRFGPVLQDEWLLAEGEALYVGHPIVLIAAESRDALAAAFRAIKIEIEERPPILSIEQAMEAGEFIGPPRTIERGDVASALAGAAHTLSGEFHVGGQEHFYLESQAALAVPGEDRTIAVHSSTQHVAEVQAMVAETLGVPFNRVICTCRRMGGAFGGKETQAAQPAMMAALVAARTGRPARFVYSKTDDMRFTGKRHPFLGRYEVGFDGDGTIVALRTDLFSNGGCSADLSLAVMERALLHSDNAYFIPACRFTGRVCRTNLPSNTAFRGFGGPQGVAVIEHVIEEVARALDLDPLDVRRRNLYGVEDRNVAPYGQRIENNTLPRLLDTLRETADYDARRAAITEANQADDGYARGLALTPVKFGISFTRATLNQANALVNVYTDGTVQVSTGATEMGQGVNTKVRQLVADELGISYDDVILTVTSTEKTNNTSPTAASSGTDLNGSAAVVACRAIRGRMAVVAADLLADAAGGLSASPESVRLEDDKVFDARRPERSMTFRELVLVAYERRVSLGGARLLRHARRRLQPRDRARHAVPLLHERRGLLRGPGRPLHRRDEAHAGRRADGPRREHQPRPRPRPGHRRVRAGRRLGADGGARLLRPRPPAQQQPDDVQDPRRHRRARGVPCRSARQPRQRRLPAPQQGRRRAAAAARAGRVLCHARRDPAGRRRRVGPAPARDERAGADAPLRRPLARPPAGGDRPPGGGCRPGRRSPARPTTGRASPTRWTTSAAPSMWLRRRRCRGSSARAAFKPLPLRGRDRRAASG